MHYIHREFCPITGQKAFEPLYENTFPIFAGCVENENVESDVICEQKWVIYESGVIALQDLIPLEILYKNGHYAGLVGEIWENHHKEFAEFVLQSSPKNVLEVGGGHGKLSKNCLAKNHNLRWTIIEPTPTHKTNKVQYIEGYFEQHNFQEDFDLITYSHLFEHIYNPNVFLNKCYKILGGGRWCLASQICKSGWRTSGLIA